MTILLGIGNGLTTSRRAGGGPAHAFSPAAMFAVGEKGAWYDPSDISTLFQNAAMTVPVAADGDPVGAMRDKSGNNIHLLQTTAGVRPTFKAAGSSRWLEFTDRTDWMVSSSTFSYNAQLDSHYTGCAVADGGSYSGLSSGQNASFRNGVSVGHTGGSSFYIYDDDYLSWSRSDAGGVTPRYFDASMKMMVGLGADNTDIDHQIDGVSGSFFDNSAPGRGARHHKVSINTTDFTSVNGADAGGDFKWYGGIVVLRSLTQSDRDNLRTFFNTTR